MNWVIPEGENKEWYEIGRTKVPFPIASVVPATLLASTDGKYVVF